MLKSNESTDDLPIVIGGPLGNNTYIFEQLHFHWGKDDSEGSETTINNKSYPMEMHAVFYKKDYESLDKAVNYSDGLTVLGYMYEVRESREIVLIFSFHCGKNVRQIDVVPSSALS